jgi:hypothetical protein
MSRSFTDIRDFLTDDGFDGAGRPDHLLDVAEEIRDLVKGGTTEQAIGMLFGQIRGSLERVAATGLAAHDPSWRMPFEDLLDTVSFLKGSVIRDASSPFGPALRRFFDRLQRGLADAVRDEEPSALAGIERSLDRLLSPPVLKPFLAAAAEASDLDRETIAEFLVALRADDIRAAFRPRNYAVH